MGPLVQLEAEYDRAMRAAQSQDNVSVRWEVGLNKKRLAVLRLSRRDDVEQRIVMGDEIMLSYDGDAAGNAPWQSVCTVIKISPTDELTLLVRAPAGAPLDQSLGFKVAFCWNSTSFDRMQRALKTFAVDEYSVTGYLYHLLLGHDVEPQSISVKMPREMHARGLPPLNPSQEAAVKAALTNPLTLIQGPPGTGEHARAPRDDALSVPACAPLTLCLCGWVLGPCAWVCRQDCDVRYHRVSPCAADAGSSAGVCTIQRRRRSSHCP
jgi:regulator of nonsense transcripts 1